MTEREVKHMSDLLEENDLVSATECTGSALRAQDEESAEELSETVSMRVSPSFTAEDPRWSPLPAGNPVTYDAYRLNHGPVKNSSQLRKQ